jgi:hypothetical protein
MKMIQVEFERRGRGKVRHTTAWVAEHWKLKPGQLVMFADEVVSRTWQVAKVGTVVQEYHEIFKTWKVGGL